MVRARPESDDTAAVVHGADRRGQSVDTSPAFGCVVGAFDSPLVQAALQPLDLPDGRGFNRAEQCCHPRITASQRLPLVIQLNDAVHDVPGQGERSVRLDGCLSYCSNRFAGILETPTFYPSRGTPSTGAVSCPEQVVAGAARGHRSFPGVVRRRSSGKSRQCCSSQSGKNQGVSTSLKLASGCFGSSLTLREGDEDVIFMRVLQP